MPKICILSTRDHRKHVIIKRLINTLLENSFEISMVDQGEKQITDHTLEYGYIQVNRLQWDIVVTNIWRVIRRIPSSRLHNQFWKGVLWFRTFSNAVRMAEVAWRENPDYYIGWDLQSTWAAVLASKFHRHPIIYCADELESEQGDLSFPRRSFFQALERKFIPKVNYLVSPNQSRADFYATRYELQTKPIIVHNCPRASPAIKNNILRERLGLIDSARVVLYHGALIPYRSLDKLIESAAYFDEDIVLVIIGEQGSYFKEILEPIYSSNQINERVCFLPYISPDEISLYVASADLGIVIYENINLNNYLCAPTKLYEFIMMKVPVAACNFPELVQLFEHYPVGVTFDAHNPKSIAQVVNDFFAKNADELATFQSALELARQRFTWENESQKWLALLNDRLDDNFGAIIQSDKYV